MKIRKNKNKNTNKNKNNNNNNKDDKDGAIANAKHNPLFAIATSFDRYVCSLCFYGSIKFMHACLNLLT